MTSCDARQTPHDDRRKWREAGFNQTDYFAIQHVEQEDMALCVQYLVVPVMNLTYVSLQTEAVLEVAKTDILEKCAISVCIKYLGILQF